MASIRKKLSMVLGLNSEGLSPSKTSRMDMSRGSMDSGYHSMIVMPRRGSQNSLGLVTQFETQGPESSPERSPRKLHKTISTTFSGAMQAFSKTVRASTSYIYPHDGEPELPSSEWAECETPKKESSRSSFMSSVRSRKQRYTPRASGARTEPPKTPQSPIPVTQENAPALKMEFPNPTFSDETLDQVSVCDGSRLLTGVKLPERSTNLWPGPTRLTVDQASGRQAIPDPVLLNLDDPYVEHEEVKRNVNTSESDGPTPACLKYVAPGSPEAETSAPCHHKDPAISLIRVPSSPSRRDMRIPPRISSSMPSGPKASEVKTSSGTAQSNTWEDNPGGRSICGRPSLEEGPDACLSLDDGNLTLEPRSPCTWQVSGVYQADEAPLKTEIGFRDAWERHRADRERRYMEIYDMALDTESDGEVENELKLRRSPSKKPVHYAEEFVQATVDAGSSKSNIKYPTGNLRYAVEAIDRAAFPVGDLAYAVEAIERPPVTTFDPLETVFQQRPMLRVSNEPETFEASDPLDPSPSCKEVPSSRIVDLSPSRVELPCSPEPSTAEVTAASEYRRTMKFADEEPMYSGAAGPGDQGVHRSPSEQSHISGEASTKQQSITASEETFEGLKPIDLLFTTEVALSSTTLSSTTSSVGEDAYQAGLRAAGIITPIRDSDEVETRAVMDEGYPKDTPIFASASKVTSHGTYRERVEARSTVPEQRARKILYNTPSSVYSDDTDDSCEINPHNPSWSAPPPFPSLDFRAELRRRRPSTEGASANDRDDLTSITGPLNTSINLAPSSPFHGPRSLANLVESKPFGSIISEGAETPENFPQASSLGQYDPCPSAGSASSMFSPGDSSIVGETFNAARLPDFASSPVIASRKARRKQKKRSRGKETFSSADFMKDTRNITSEPDFSVTPHKRERIKNSTSEKTSISPGQHSRTMEGRLRKPNSDKRRNRCSGNQTMFDEISETDRGDGWSVEPGSRSKTSKNSPGREGQASKTLCSPRQLRVRDRGSSDRFHEHFSQQ